MSLLAAFMATLQQGWTPAFQFAADLSFPAALSQQLGTTSNTWEFWGTPNADTSRRPYLYVLEGDDPGSRFHSHFPFVNGAFYFSCGNINAGGQTPPLYLATGQEWYGVPHHFAVVVDAQVGTMSLYLDGELAYQQQSYSLRQPSSAQLLFLTDQGQAGNVRAWTYARTQEQIKNVMRRLINNPRPGLLLNVWGNERGPAGTLVRDRSGNNFHATIS